MKWNVFVLRRSGECERTEVADFELSEFFNRIASVEGKAWVLSVERVGWLAGRFAGVLQGIGDGCGGEVIEKIGVPVS